MQLLQQYKVLDDELKAKEQEVKETNQKLLDSEKRLVEMTTYVRSLKQSIFSQEKDLSGIKEPKKKTVEEDQENQLSIADE